MELAIIMFLLMGLMVSTTINIAFLCIMYINWINDKIKKDTTHLL